MTKGEDIFRSDQRKEPVKGTLPVTLEVYYQKTHLVTPHALSSQHLVAERQGPTRAGGVIRWILGVPVPWHQSYLLAPYVPCHCPTLIYKTNTGIGWISFVCMHPCLWGNHPFHVPYSLGRATKRGSGGPSHSLG